MKKCPSCSEVLSWETEFCSGCGAETDYFMQPAGFWIRVLASIVDGLVFIPLIILGSLNLFLWQNPILIFVALIPGLIYKPCMESFYGATLGKMVCKIWVLNDDGKKLSVGRAYVRFLPGLVSSLVDTVKTLILFALIDYEAGGTFMENIQQFGEVSKQAGEQPMFQVVNIMGTIVLIFIIIDVLFVAFTERKRAIHDYMAGSYCVYKPTAEQMQAIANMPVQGGDETQEYSEYFKQEKDTGGE